MSASVFMHPSARLGLRLHVDSLPHRRGFQPQAQCLTWCCCRKNPSKCYAGSSCARLLSLPILLVWGLCFQNRNAEMIRFSPYSGHSSTLQLVYAPVINRAIAAIVPMLRRICSVSAIHIRFSARPPDSRTIACRVNKPFRRALPRSSDQCPSTQQSRAQPLAET